MSFACTSDSLFFYWITDHLNGLTLILSCRHGWGRWSVRNTRAGFKWHDESRLLQRIPGFSCTSNQVSCFCSPPHYYECSANKMTDATNCLVQGWSWCPRILRVVILGQLWVGYGLHQEVWHCLCGLQEWALRAPQSISPVVLTLPEGWGCWKQSWYKLSKQPVASKGTLHIQSVQVLLLLYRIVTATICIIIITDALCSLSLVEH